MTGCQEPERLPARFEVQGRGQLRPARRPGGMECRRGPEGVQAEDQGPDGTSGSTDMANVSWVVPTIHPDLSITDQPTPGHSIEFRDAAGRPRADETVLLASTLVAQTALDLLLDPALVEAAWAEFRR